MRGTPAAGYKKHMLELDEHIKNAVASEKEASSYTATRSMDWYDLEYGNLAESMNVLDANGRTDDAKWGAMWRNLNSEEDNVDQLVDIDDLVVPLFHGVPFMNSQYTNHERREIFEVIVSMNNKLMGKFKRTMTPEESQLTPQEEALLNIYSRTATASAKLQSLYEIIKATPEEIAQLQKVDKQLLEYFRGHEFNDAFKNAMKIFIFEFGRDRTAEFWKNVKESSASKSYPDYEVTKYRFPFIATAKAPDHGVKFAMGSNVEEATRGELALSPNMMMECLLID
jgi:hypothetical protein